MNPHKNGTGRSVLGCKPEPLFTFANLIVQSLKDRFPGLIWEQVLRVDFWQHVETKKFYLNEVEGFNAQKVSRSVGGSTAKGANLDNDLTDYWFHIICFLVNFELLNRTSDL